MVPTSDVPVIMDPAMTPPRIPTPPEPEDVPQTQAAAADVEPLDAVAEASLWFG